MKRYLTLLTISFLSTSTLVEAVKLDIFNLPANSEEKAASLRAKAAKLQSSIAYTESASLRDAFEMQESVINNLLLAPLTEQDSNYYSEAQEQKNKIVATFIKEAIDKQHRPKRNTIKRVLNSGIYARKSDEFKVLKDAEAYIHFIEKKGSRVPGKSKLYAGRYLKMEKLTTQYLQKADQIREECMADLKKIKKSDLVKDLAAFDEGVLNPDSDEYKAVSKASESRRVMFDKYSWYPFRSLVEAIKDYKALEKELELIIAPYRQPKQEAPGLIPSIFSGDYAKLEEDSEELEDELSLRYPRYKPTPEDVTEFFYLMEQIRNLPNIFVKLDELKTKVQELRAAYFISNESEVDQIREECMADLKKIKKSDLVKDVAAFDGEILNPDSEEYKTVSKASESLQVMFDKYSRYPSRLEAIKDYKALEKELELIIARYRQPKQEATALVPSIFSGDYAKLEEDSEELEDELSFRYPHYKQTPEEVTEFFYLMEQIRNLPNIFVKLEELKTKVRELRAAYFISNESEVPVSGYVMAP